MVDYQNIEHGNVVYPLTNPGNLSTLKLIDPPLYWTLDFYTNIIQIHCGAVWSTAVTQAGLAELAGSVVKYSLPYNPLPYMQEQQIKFPLLAVFEKKATLEFKTLSYLHSSASWQVAFILPPLTSGQCEILHPFLKGVRDLLAIKTLYGCDPSYQSGLVVWDASVSGIEKMRVTGSTISDLPLDGATGSLFYPTLLLDLQVDIRQNAEASWFQTLAGADITQNLDGYQFLQDKVDFP